MKYFFSITIILITLFFAWDVHAGIITKPVFHTGLIGYWDFQEGAGSNVYDKSGNDNDGTWSGSGWLLNEGFEGAGYEESGWSENIGDGCIVDEDNTDVTPPPGGGSQVLRIYATGNGNYARARRYFNPQESNVWVTFYFYLDSISETDIPFVVLAQDNTWQYAYAIYINNVGETPLIGCNIYNDGSWGSVSSTEISLDTWHKIDIKYDNTGGAYEWRLDGVSQASGSLTGTTAGGTYYYVHDGVSWYDGHETNFYIDRVWIDDNEYGYDASHWTDGKIGKGGSFNGSDDYVDSTNFADNLSNFSVSAWFKTSATPSGSGVTTIVSKLGSGGWPTGVGWSITMTKASTYNGYRSFAFIQQNGSTYRGKYNDLAMNDGNWHHVVMVVSSFNCVNLYVDGVLATNAVTGGTVSSITTAANVRVGNDYDGEYFSGSVDEVRTYNRALSESEVNRLYKMSQPKMLAPTMTGLVGYWSFEEGTGTNVGDMSGNGNHGTWNGTGSHWATGRFGNGGDFNGSDDYVDTNYTTDLTNFTISAWVKGNNEPNDSKYGPVIWRGNNFGMPWDHTNASYRGGVSVRVSSTWYPASFGTLNANTWYHLVGTYDGENLKAYKDGVLITDNSSPSGNPDSDARDLVFGMDLEEANSYFNGKIDEVRIYNRALDANEIQVLYNSSVMKFNSSQNNQLTDGLVGLWSFNGPDMDGDTAYDRSGSGNTGTLTGTTRAIGKVGQALEFNGSSDYVKIANESNFDITGQITVSAWINSDTTSLFQVFAGKCSGGTVESAFTLQYNNAPTNRIRFQIYGATAYNADSDSDITPGNWYHAVGVYDETEVALYINGVKQADTETFSGSINTNNYNVRIGSGWYGSEQEFMDGKIDEVRIYNRALTAQEVLRLYNLGR